VKTASPLPPNPGKPNQAASTLSAVPVLLFGFFGLSNALRLNIGGQLSGFEVLAMAGAALALFLPGQQRRPLDFRLLLIGVGAWLGWQLLVDAYQAVGVINLAKGAARVVTFGASLLFLLHFVVRDRVRLGSFLVGLGFSFIVDYFLDGRYISSNDPWKWCWGPAATFVCLGVLLMADVKSKLTWRLCLIVLSICHFAFNFRSLGASCFLAGVAPFFWPLIKNVGVWVRMGVAVGAVVVFAIAYNFLAAGGHLGTKAQEKHAMQAKDGAGPFSLLAGGRKEYRASIKAIKEQPIIGYGSWAQHPEFVYELHDPEDGEFSLDKFSTAMELGIIPTHSHLMGAWVDGGILPGLFWLSIWCYVFYLVCRLDWSRAADDCLALLFGGGLLWSILFSPFGTGNRLTTALGLCIVLCRGWSELVAKPAPVASQGPVSDAMNVRRRWSLRTARRLTQ
jgi:hypothetical protein